MANAKTNSSSAATPAERLERLISSCHLMKQNLDQLICALDIAESSIPDKENSGVALAGMIRLLIAHQNDEYTGFLSEIRIAEGEAA